MNNLNMNLFQKVLIYYRFQLIFLLILLTILGFIFNQKYNEISHSVHLKFLMSNTINYYETNNNLAQIKSDLFLGEPNSKKLTNFYKLSYEEDVCFKLIKFFESYLMKNQSVCTNIQQRLNDYSIQQRENIIVNMGRSKQEINKLNDYSELQYLFDSTENLTLDHLDKNDNGFEFEFLKTSIKNGIDENLDQDSANLIFETKVKSPFLIGVNDISAIKNLILDMVNNEQINIHTRNVKRIENKFQHILRTTKQDFNKLTSILATINLRYFENSIENLELYNNNSLNQFKINPLELDQLLIDPRLPSYISPFYDSPLNPYIDLLISDLEKNKSNYKNYTTYHYVIDHMNFIENFELAKRLDDVMILDREATLRTIYSSPKSEYQFKTILIVSVIFFTFLIFYSFLVLLYSQKKS